MKKLAIILFFLISSLAFSQNGEITYPRIDKDVNGTSIMIFTIAQVQKLDNDLDILDYFKKLDQENINQDAIFVKVVNDKNEVIASQKLEISKINELVVNKDSQIKTLQDQVTEYIKTNKLLELQIVNKDKIIGEKNTQITKLQTKMLISGIGGGLAILGLVLALIK